MAWCGVTWCGVVCCAVVRCGVYGVIWSGVVCSVHNESIFVCRNIDSSSQHSSQQNIAQSMIKLYSNDTGLYVSKRKGLEDKGSG